MSMSKNYSFEQLLGKYLRRIRMQQRNSLEEVAEMADLSATHLGRIERGEKLPSTYTLYKLKIALNFSVDQMFNEISKEEIKEY